MIGMSHRGLRSVALACSLCLAAFVPVIGQARPSAAQAQDLLRVATPETVARLQHELQASGLSPDQIRARLIAEGYPPGLLDAYLPGGKGDSTSVPSPDVFAAIRKLGIVGTTAGDSTSNSGLGERRQPKTPAIATAPADSGFQLFGLDVFQRTTTQFDANLAGPVPSNYRIGPGDELVLILTGQVEASYSLPVTREGFIFLPNVGQVPVANLTMSQLQDLLYTRLGNVYSGVRRGGGSTHFDVTISRLGTSQVSVLGDVATPGSYRVSKLGTMLSALYAAGGPTQNGNMRAVELRRGGDLVGTLDLYDYLLSGNASHDLRLETGDIVFVRPMGARVRLAGAVVRPATYELKTGETLRDLLRMAGGLRPEADRRRLQIDRVVPPAQRTAAGRDRMLFDVSSAAVESSTEPLQAGDIVRVLEIAPHVANRVVVTGNVWQPGSMAYVPGLTLSAALRAAGGLKPDTYLSAVQVNRLNPDSTRTMVSTSLRDIAGNPTTDVSLQPDDEIRVFSLSEYRTPRFVAVTGAVHAPGPIPYRENMTLREALMLAGGLQESALLTEAEVAHMPPSRTNGALSTTERVPLDSTYLFERGPDGRYQGPPGVAVPASTAPEVTLRPYDNVLILRQTDWSLPQTVAVDGEVKFPGVYTLRAKSDRVSDVIERAGGLTGSADAGAAVFTRSQGNIGRISIDLPEILANPRSRDNMLLATGDAIRVPKYAAVVTVQGAVYNPVTIAYVPGANLDYYIDAAGGPTAQADDGRAYVVQANGKVEPRRRHGALWNSNVKPQAGSTVNVPAKPADQKRDWVSAATAFTSILGSLVAIAAITRR